MSKTILDRIIAYETGELYGSEVIALFQDLVDSGLAWKLQGRYGRVANALIARDLVKVRQLYHPVGVPCDICTDPRAMFAVCHVTMPCPQCGDGVQGRPEMLPTGRTTVKCPNCGHEDTVAEESS